MDFLDDTRMGDAGVDDRGLDDMGLDNTGLGEEQRRARMRLKIARALMGQAVGGGPVQSPLQGLARMAGGALGAWQAGRAQEELARPRREALDEMAQSLRGQTLPDPKVAGPRTGSGTFLPASPEQAARHWLHSDNPWVKRAGIDLAMGPLRRR